MSAQFDTVSRGLKAQMKYADKLGALYTVVLGDTELETRKAMLKNMQNGTQTEISLDDFTDAFQSLVIKDAMAGFDDLGLSEEDLAQIIGGAK